MIGILNRVAAKKYVLNKDGILMLVMVGVVKKERLVR